MAVSLILAAAAIGGCAVLTDRRATERELAAEAEFPPTGQLLQVGGRTVHAHVQGSGPDLVLIHGASGNTRDFTFALVGKLAQDYRVIAFDRPGLGWTDDLGAAGVSPLEQARVLRAAADQLGVTRPIVMGHSYGGSVAMAWGLADPRDVAALVIVSGATMPWPGGLGPFYAVTGTKLGGATIVPAITAFVSPDKAEAVVDGVFAPAPAPDGYAEYVGVGLSMRRHSLRANGRQVWGLKPYVTRMSAEYPKLTLPVEIVHGTADTTVPADIHAVPLSKLLPDARLTLLPDVAHMPHHSNPAAVIEAIHRAATRAGLR